MSKEMKMSDAFNLLIFNYKHLNKQTKAHHNDGLFHIKALIQNHQDMRYN